MGLRGELTRWMLEIKTGVFIGTLSALVRDKIWDKACENAGDEGGCILIQSAANEQGFLLRTSGRTSRLVEDFEGLQLIRRPADLARDLSHTTDNADDNLPREEALHGFAPDQTLGQE